MYVPHGNNVPTSLQTPIGNPPVIGSSCEDMLIDQPQVPYNEDLWDGNTQPFHYSVEKFTPSGCQ